MASISRKNSIYAAIFINSFFFCIMHFFNNGVTLLALVNLFLFGVLESLIFLKWNSIWIAGAVHSIWNYMQGCVFGLGVSGEHNFNSIFLMEQNGQTIANGGDFGPEGSFATTIVLVSAIIVLVIKMRSKGVYTDAAAR